ncbi:MAG: alginate export family protein [Candidatus Omnitrophota bacterium]
MRFLKVACVLAIALCVTGSVYAETQSVKVSGDLTMRGIYRNDYALISQEDENINTNASVTKVDSTNQSWAMTVAAVQVDADLTDNVTTVIRMLNQRDWNVAVNRTTQTTDLTPNGRGGYLPTSEEFDVMVDLAYVQLKNFIYSPLTLTIGRQDLWFGKGFIIGANQQNPGNSALSYLEQITGAGAMWNTTNTLVPGNLSAPEYTAMNSFDSVKAVLDYDPWTITGVYAIIYEDSVQARDNVDLWGVNIGYKFNKMNGEAEGYWFYKADRQINVTTDLKNSTNDVHTVGLRGSFDPINWLTLAGEGAVQGGEYVGNQHQNVSRGRLAMALDFSAEARYFTEKYSWKPKFGAEYVYYSGNKAEDEPRMATGTYHGWDSMYRGKYDSAIREFIGKFYQTARYPARATYSQSCADDSRTNQHQVIFLGSIQPMDSLTLKANYNLFWNDQAYLNSAPTQGLGGTTYGQGFDKTLGFIGQELDLQANWDYTEDVSFNLLAGWFVPGTVYYDGKADTATDLVGSVKVSF